MAKRKSAVFQGVEELSEEDCLEIARLKMKSSDLTVENVTMKTFSDTPAGFLGDHYKVVMTIRMCNQCERGEELVDLHFFVKTKPRDPAHTEFGENLGAFKREFDFYSKLVVLFRKYSSDSNGCEEDLKLWTPDCFFANSKLIVLDDLSHQGFRLSDGRPGLDYNHCVVLFQSLARFHASSIIFEEKEGQRLGKTLRLNEIYPETLTESIWTKEPGYAGRGRQICEAGAKATVALAKLMSQTSQDPERYERVLNALGRLFDEGCRLAETSSEHRNVVCHGDLWTNNILFRYDSTGTPQNARLIDYQFLRYAAPGSDFMCVLYLNTRRETREKHFPDLARIYHSTLAEELAKHRLDAEKIVPWTAFKSSLEYYRWLGIYICCVYYPNTLLADDAAKEVTSDQEMFMKFLVEDQSEPALRSFETDDIYRQRMREIVEELADYLSNKL